MPYIGYNADHDSVVELFDKASKRGLEVMYLTARSMAMDKDTRDYLFRVRTRITQPSDEPLKRYFY